MNENVLAKLKVLAESAKYDVSCSSSGTVRRNQSGTLGNTVGGWGICHSFAEDGRCISLLKIMLTNYCIYDCAYCINRRSNDIPRATLSVSELVDLTIEFYRRNYIEGLFLSSGVVRNPDYTMERLVRVAKDLRLVHKFNGYIHLKSIPGASRELVNEAGLYADRLSVNIEIPKEENLKLLAPEKDHKSVYQPMRYIQQGILTNKEDRKKFRHVPRFVPAGCCAQMVGFAVASFRENKWGGLFAQGIGTSMLQMGNIVKNPRIWLPATLASAITGPIATCLFHLQMNGAAVSSGMGTCGLVGQIGVYTGWIADIEAGSKAAITPMDWIGLIFVSFLLPGVLSWLFSVLFRKIGWIKEGDMRLDL